MRVVSPTALPCYSCSSTHPTPCMMATRAASSSLAHGSSSPIKADQILRMGPRTTGWVPCACNSRPLTWRHNAACEHIGGGPRAARGTRHRGMAVNANTRNRRTGVARCAKNLQIANAISRCVGAVVQKIVAGLGVGGAGCMQGRAGQGRAGRSRAGRRAGQGRAGQGRAGQGRAGQVKARTIRMWQRL